LRMPGRLSVHRLMCHGPLISSAEGVPIIDGGKDNRTSLSNGFLRRVSGAAGRTNADGRAAIRDVAGTASPPDLDLNNQ
ncbi:MAG: hypothetical protein ACE5EQ_11910, partial [Phycisphaerae bacterium]